MEDVRNPREPDEVVEVEPTWTDNRYLGDLPAIDGDQREQRWKQSKEYKFDSVAEASRFMNASVLAAFNGIGLDPGKPGTDARFMERRLERQLKKKQIRIEHDQQWVHKENWKCGTYVYKRDELCYFISTVFRHGKFDPHWRVITNVKVDDKRIQIIGG